MLYTYFKRFFKLSFHRKKLLLITPFLSLLTYILMRFFNSKTSFQTSPPLVNFSSENIQRMRDVRYAIKLTAKYTPWQNLCRHQAYQAKILCNYYRIPYQIYVGFKTNKKTNKIEGHAWTMVYGKIITGFCNPLEYTVQAVYTNK